MNQYLAIFTASMVLVLSRSADSGVVSFSPQRHVASESSGGIPCGEEVGTAAHAGEPEHGGRGGWHRSGWRARRSALQRIVSHVWAILYHAAMSDVIGLV